MRPTQVLRTYGPFGHYPPTDPLLASGTSTVSEFLASQNGRARRGSLPLRLETNSCTHSPSRSVEPSAPPPDPLPLCVRTGAVPTPSLAHDAVGSPARCASSAWHRMTGWGS